MRTKKVILFIVEGITDKISLGGIIDKLITTSLVKFYITNGDITSEQYSSVTNVREKVNKHVKQFLSINSLKRSDLLQIVHLIDMDGAYVREDQIREDDVEDFLYSEEAIIANSINRVIRRNLRKQQVINRLSLNPVINGTPYRMYYFSCNLEHVLHNKINISNELKIKFAEDFTDSFYKNENAFIDFINDKDFAVAGDFKETWEFIKMNGNSLKRYSNFHLFFE